MASAPIVSKSFILIMFNITGRTTLVGVIGWPVEHSCSPPMQNAALRELGLDWVYVAFPVPPERLPEARICNFELIHKI